MEQLILHLTGDYLTQSDWMAQNKTKASFPAAAHAIVYSLPFLFLGPSWLAFAVILGTHFLVDRFRLARFVVWFKNIILSAGYWKHAMWWPTALWDCEQPECKSSLCLYARELKWLNCKDTGYPSERPAWLAVWLLIAADNTLHLAINYAALRWL